MRTNKRTKVNSKTESPKRWRGIIVLDAKHTRASVHPLRNKDGSRVDMQKLVDLMDREFRSEAPHRAFIAIERRDESDT